MGILIKSLLTAFILLSIFSQIIHGFCIYNQISSDIATIDLFEPTVDQRRSFKKVISPGGKECCHFSNKDCNPTGDREANLYFHGWLNFNGFYREGRKKVIKCQAGGALNIYGTSPENARAVCMLSNGGMDERALLGNVE